MAQKYLPSSASSCCSDLREINEAKVANILSYLEEQIPPPAAAMIYQDPTLSTDGPFFSSASLRGSITGMPAIPTSGASVASGLTTLATENHVLGTVKSKIEALRSTNETLMQENKMLHAKVAEDKKQYEARILEVRQIAKTELERFSTELQQRNMTSSEAMRKLIKEKDATTRALEDMTHKLRQANEALDTQKKNLEAAHALALSREKSSWRTAETAAREKWRNDETVRLKKAVLENLRPELAEVIAKHAAQKDALQRDFNNQLQSLKNEAADREASFENIKAELQRKAEERIAYERRYAEERAKEEVDRVRRSAEDERQHMEKQKESLRSVFEEKENNLKREMRRLQEENIDLQAKQFQAQAQFRDEVGRRVAELSSSQDGVLRLQREQLELDMKRKEDVMREENNRFLSQREEELKLRLAAERDIEVSKALTEMEQTYKQEIAKKKEVERLEKDEARRRETKILELQAAKELVEQQLLVARESLKQKDETVARLNKELEEVKSQLEHHSAHAEREMDSRLRFLEAQFQQRLRSLEAEKVDEVSHLQLERKREEDSFFRQRSQLEEQLRSLEHQHNAELSEVEKKITVAVATRDGKIAELRDKVAVLEHTLAQMQEQHRTLLES